MAKIWRCRRLFLPRDVKLHCDRSRVVNWKSVSCTARAEQLRSRASGVAGPDDAELERVIRMRCGANRLMRAQKAYWDQSFFSMLDDGQTIIYGNAALRAYFGDPLGGVLVRSPKSFLGSDIHESHLARFEDIVTAMLGHIVGGRDLNGRNPDRGHGASGALSRHDGREGQ